MLRRLAHKNFIWWCGLIFSVATIATAADLAPFQVKHWSTTEGLPQSRAACLKLTRDGYLWIGTWYGLVRFNGVGFTVFSQFNTPEFAVKLHVALQSSHQEAAAEKLAATFPDRLFV